MTAKWGKAAEALMALRGRLSGARRRGDAAEEAELRDLYRALQRKFRR
jgi:hypothetical protein